MALYVVAVYSSADAARRANLAAWDQAQPAWLDDPEALARPIAHPVSPETKWLRGYQSPVSGKFWPKRLRDCYAIGGVRHGNILMLAQIDNWGSVTPPGQVTCQTSYTWTTHVLAALYLRAQG
jgi:hypothetical protein